MSNHTQIADCRDRWRWYGLNASRQIAKRWRRFCWLDKLPLCRNLNCMSEALQYLTDETGNKTAVVLPLTDYEKLLEDLDDLAAIAERREEPTIPHEQFKAELRRDGLL